MSSIAVVPSAIHRGADELPWVDAGGVLLRVSHVSERHGVAVIQNHLTEGYTAIRNGGWPRCLRQPWRSFYRF